MKGLGLLAGTYHAAAQGFIRHFDAQQVEKPGAVVSVREVPGGYLLFCSQVSADGTNRTRPFTRLLNAEGVQVSEQEFFVGFQRHHAPGNIDPFVTCNDGSFAVAMFDISVAFDMGISLFKFNQQGDTIATNSTLRFPVEDSLFVNVHHLRQCLDGGYYMVGMVEPYVPESALERALLIRIDANGDTIWTKLYSPNTSLAYTARGVAAHADGGAVLIGERLGIWPDASWLMRTDFQGDMTWIRYFGNRGAPQDCAVRLDNDVNIITYSAYREQSFPTLYGQFMLTKWNPDGDIIWQKKSHYGRNYYVGDFEVMPDNSIVAVGSHDGGGELMRFSAEGDSLWTRQYVAFASSERHRLFDVQPTSDGGFVAAGSCDQYWGDPTPNLETEWMIKTDSMGCVVPGCHTVGVQEVVVDLQAHLRIAPNPASNVLQAELPLPPGAVLQGAARAVLLNAQGQQVQAWPMRHSGEALSLREDISALPSGAYYLHIADEKRWLAGGKVVVE